MNQVRHHGGWVVVVSFLVALLLVVFPLPEGLQHARPQWVALILIYWTMALPDRVGAGTGWLVGLLQDLLQSNLLGQHALAYGILAFLSIKLHQRIRVFPLWQQALAVMVLLLLTRLIVLWTSGVTGRAPDTSQYWFASVTSTALWPVVFLVMRSVRQRFSVR